MFNLRGGFFKVKDIVGVRVLEVEVEKSQLEVEFSILVGLE